MLYTLDKNRQHTASLENAFNVSYEKTINQLWTAEFSMPLYDVKVDKVKSLQFVEIEHDAEYIGLFRVMPKKIKKNVNDETITIELEHVLGTLIGSVLFKYHQVTGYTIPDVIKYILDRQKTKDWVLGQCDFNMQFDYAWENENLLSALFSITKTFEDKAMWTFDTSTYPWKINLKRVPTIPTGRILEGYNLTGLEVEENPNGLWNRIYALGSAEGVNQVDILKVNNNLPYIQDTTSINKYGLYETILVDKEIKDSKSLLSLARKRLKEWKEPIISFNISAVDLSEITGLSLDKLRLGNVITVSLDDYGDQELLIVKESKSNLYGSYEDIKLELGNLGQNLASANAEQQRRQQVNDLYSQGATNILNFGYQDNCDSNIPALITFFIDEDVVNVNTCELTFETKKFRAYSGTTIGGGGVSKSTASGGGTSKSTASGGGVSKSTGAHYHKQPSVDGWTGYEREVTVEEEQRVRHHHQMFIEFTGYEHTHSMDIPTHTHNLEIPSHSHDFEIPSHTHGVEHKIVESGSIPSSVTIKVDGTNMPVNSTNQERLNLIDYLRKDSDGKVSRGKHTIEIYPTGIARIEANLILRVFIQSQLGGKY